MSQHAIQKRCQSWVCTWYGPYGIEKPKAGETKASGTSSRSTASLLDKKLVLDEKNQLTDRVLKVFKEMFYQFASSDGMMMRQHVSQWLSVGLNEPVNQVHYAVQEVMRGDNGRQMECMLLDDFNKTLRIYARTDISKLWTVLQNCGYNANLLTKEEVQANKLEAEVAEQKTRAAQKKNVDENIVDANGREWRQSQLRRREKVRYPDILANNDEYLKVFTLLGGFQEAGLSQVAGLGPINALAYESTIRRENKGASKLPKFRKQE